MRRRKIWYNDKVHLTVIGIGYVGLVSAVGFAEMGNTVTCLVKRTAHLRLLRRGTPTIYEPGLQEFLQRNLKEGRIMFTQDRRAAIQSAEIIFIAVGTPQGADGAADLSAVWAVGEDIGTHLNGPKLIVTKSTVPVGTGEKLKVVIRKALGKRRIRFGVVSNPEFLREGAAVKDFLNPDRIIVGVENARAAAVMAELYRSITRTERPLMLTDLRSAELIKYASNCFLAVKISFINEVANFCERVGANVGEVAKGMGLDHRIGARFLHAGIGYGGSCFPKDVHALLAAGRDRGIPFRIVQAAHDVNAAQRMVVLEKLRHFHPKLAGKTIAVWGLSFKPRTDDVRESPALDIIAELLAAGARVAAFDPIAIPNARTALPRSRSLRFTPDPYDALHGASALIITTEWDEFRQPDFPKMRRLMTSPTIVDGRNVYAPEAMARLGFRYASIGRPVVRAASGALPKRKRDEP